MEKNIKMGVIIGRFQIDMIHGGHNGLFTMVNDLSDRMIIFLGCGKAVNTRKNPLDFQSRKLMIQESCPSAEIYPLYDNKSNEIWSQKLDATINDLIKEPSDVTLYGAKDSFIPFYSGKFKTEILTGAIVEGEHATTMREKIAKTPNATADYRRGMITAAYNRYPATFPTVDIAILDDHNRVLLGRKPDETDFRFVGGFVDPTDESLEAAAKREAIEECGKIELDGFKYVASVKVNDWRYANSIDGIMTSFFVCKYIYGAPKASDDIEAIKWFDLDTLTEDMIVGEHKKLLVLLKNYIVKDKELNLKLDTYIKAIADSGNGFGAIAMDKAKREILS